MELFMLVSFTGMLVLLATHVVDFVVVTRRPVGEWVLAAMIKRRTMLRCWKKRWRNTSGRRELASCPR